MADDESSKVRTEAQEKEPVFGFGVVWIGKEKCMLILEDTDGLLEGDGMLAHIGYVLLALPLKAKTCHNAIVFTL